MRSAVYGVGSSFFGKQPDVSVERLVWQAVQEALAEACVDHLDAVYVGTVFGAPGVAQRCLHSLGIAGIPIVTVENACASGATAFHEARYAVESGRYGSVLALGLEQMSLRFQGAIDPEPTDVEGRAGMIMPALYGLAAQRYINCYGLTPQSLASVAVKNHRHALLNNRAQHKGDYTIDEVLASRMISDPLTRLQCCSISDGAAAAVLGPERRHSRDVLIRGSALRSGKLWDHRSTHVWGFEVVVDTARDAFEEAGLGPSEVDVLEVHDSFTIGEIVSIEGIGLAPEGDGGRLVESGQLSLGGRQPVNPSGGLLARGHPLGATGLAQLHEIVTQLRGEASSRQVEGARIGLIETSGGGVAGIDANGCVVTILERSSTKPQ
jgi:acetyl-CoA acetyltransferase